MAIGWFLCGFTIHPTRPNVRFCAMNQFNASIDADAGGWNYVEVLGGYAIAKVRASSTTLTTIAGTTGFQRIPPAFLNLSDTLGSLTTTQRNAILATLQDMGYTLAEISTALGSNLAGWRNHTLGDLLHFIAQRRLEEHFDEVSGQIVLDGPFVSPGKTVEVLDGEVVA